MAAEAVTSGSYLAILPQENFAVSITRYMNLLFIRVPHSFHVGTKNKIFYGFTPSSIAFWYNAEEVSDRWVSRVDHSEDLPFDPDHFFNDLVTGGFLVAENRMETLPQFIVEAPEENPAETNASSYGCRSPLISRHSRDQNE